MKEDDQVRETPRKGIAVLRGGRTRTFNPASFGDEFTCGVRIEMEFKQLTASQCCRERALEGCNPEDHGVKKTTTFTTSPVASHIIADPAGDLHKGVRLLAFAERRAAQSEHCARALSTFPTRAIARDHGVALEPIADIVEKFVREAFVF